MSTRIRSFSILIILLFLSFPVYAQSYEGVNIGRTIFRLIFYIIIFVAIIFFSLYGTKLVAKNFKGMTNSKYIEILDAINIPGGSKIVITKVNNKIYVLATGNSGTNILDIMDENEFPIIEENFDGYLNRYLTKDNLNYAKISENIKLNLDKFTKKKDKEGNKNEKQD
jgi:flagellar biogenesis protein FliO